MIPIDCHFNDIDLEKVGKVKNAIRDKSLHYPEFGNMTFTDNDYKDEVEVLTKLIPSLRKEKVFVFIDPYEYKNISAEDIKGLVLNKGTEVLLFLPTQFMYRFDNDGAPQALKDFIEELVEYRNWKRNDSVWSFIDQLRDALRSYLGKHHFVDTFTIEKDANTVFCLFFFSSHIKGFEKMLEAKWEIDTEQGKGWNYTNNAPSLFYELRTNPLEEKLKSLLKRKTLTNGEVYEFTLKAGFLPTHANEILYNWQKNGCLEVEDSTGGSVRRRAFYISYVHYRNNPGRVAFKLR